MSPSVLITGATGLLGRAVLKHFTENNWDVTGLGFTRAEDPILKIDLTDFDALDCVIDDNKPNIIVHCAAEKRPDFVENNHDQSWKLNVSVTQRIVQKSKETGAIVIYISTDYVFDGESPPYKPDDPINPLNKYGEMKVESEIITLNESSGNCVLRVPLLYGKVTKVEESGVTALIKEIKATNVPKLSSDFEIRHPAHTDDIAEIVYVLASKKLEDPSKIRGIYQWSGDESLSRYKMMKIIANQFGLPMDHISPNLNPTHGAKRPKNVLLDTSRLKELGIKQKIQFNDGIRNALFDFV